MDAQIITQFLSEAMANLDIAVIIALMGVGFCVKHFKFLSKVENDVIPPLLVVISLVLTFFQHGISIQSAITAIVSSATAIGLHQKGKNIFSFIVPKIGSIISPEKEEEVTEEESVSEETNE